MLLRHLLAIAILPFMVVVVVPHRIMSSRLALDTALSASLPLAIASSLLGGLLFLAGLALFAWCVTLFVRVGQGTLAPWDPTRRLVIAGPYRHVRNPMISGVAFMLSGESIFFLSQRVALWLALFVLFNHPYFLLSEEPGLARRFGAEYERYRRAVPRWVPRWRGWDASNA